MIFHGSGGSVRRDVPLRHSFPCVTVSGLIINKRSKNQPSLWRGFMCRDFSQGKKKVVSSVFCFLNCQIKHKPVLPPKTLGLHEIGVHLLSFCSDHKIQDHK